jgi:hypothetical protein
MDSQISIEELLVTTEPTREVEVRVDDERSFTVSLRRLSFVEKTACISSATDYETDERGQVKAVFHLDRYYVEALKRMIVKAPWPITSQMLQKLRPEIGQQLFSLVPPPFGDEPSENFFGGSVERSKGKKRTP